MGFQNQGLQSAAPVSTSSTQFVSNESSQSGFQSSPQGVLLLPRGEVVHILPTALPQQPHALPLIPAAALFTSVVGALLQSQNTTHNDIETPITDPVLILTSKVVRVEWPESEGRQGQYSSNGRKHRKKRSKKPKSDSSDKFDGSSFFYTVSTSSTEDTPDLESVDISILSDELSSDAKRLSKLKSYANSKQLD